MEAMGRLAGGIAHDFNNLLSVVLSYSELLIADTPRGAPARSDLDEIHEAALRAAALTTQLLAFSRRQVVEPRVLDLNVQLAGLDRMLHRVLGEDIDLVSTPGSDLGRVLADPSHVDQVVLNLVVNARDAMPRGGELTIETSNVDLDESYTRDHFGARVGRHVMLAVTDTGCGMDAATVARVFEPFFTTKPQGKGTGLGLSTVFGIVQQAGGSIWVYSEPGKGSTFKVYFPRVDAEVEPVADAPALRTVRGTETVLLVEDNDALRAVARSILSKNGYDVIDAASGAEALRASARHAGRIHLLLTDVVMPQMSGPELAARLAPARPDMKVLCMSGYTDDSVVRHGVLEPHHSFIQKPITPESLARKVRAVLDARASGRP
jgi:CheY-like chemotaxis protein